MQIGELARRTGLSVHTIRYYERIGLLPRADRDAGGRRDYDVSILSWIAFLDRLETTGMPIRDMLQYADMRVQGEHTGLQRCALLEAHRAAVRGRVDDLNACLLVLDSKIDAYVETEQRTQHDKRRPDK